MENVKRMCYNTVLCGVVDQGLRDANKGYKNNFSFQPLTYSIKYHILW
jgi:hypothetical protein